MNPTFFAAKTIQQAGEKERISVATDLERRR
jgi:hypothetical protein